MSVDRKALARAALAESARIRALLAGPGADFGTIGGQHTLCEVVDLIAAKDYGLTQAQNAADANRDLIVQKDPTWFKDWATMLAGYKAVRLKAAALKSLPGLNKNMTPAEGTYQEILKSLRKNQTGPFTDQDEQGLFQRLVKIGVVVDTSKTPQPKCGDIDLTAFKAADVARKDVEDIEREAGKQAALAAQAAAEGARQAALAAAKNLGAGLGEGAKKDPVGTVVGVALFAGVVGVAGYAAYKIYVPKFPSFKR